MSSACSQNLLDASGRDELLPPTQSSARTTWIISLSTAFGYALSYFWRYPVFMLPSDVLNEHVVTVLGRDLDLQACLSLAFILGFGCAKLPAACFASSRFFFAHRFASISSILIGSMLVEGLGLLLFDRMPALQLLAVFCSSFGSSALFGLMVTYLEGRRATEAMLAVMTGMLIYAGNLSRGAAAGALRAGVPPRLMPLIVGLVACPLACALTLLTHRAPGPSASDISSRTRRMSMGSGARRAFVGKWALGLGALVAAYALLTGTRSVRDLYSKQIFAASLGLDDAPSYVFLVADLPGALLAVGALMHLGTVTDHRRALLTMLCTMLGSTAVGMCATALFEHGLLGGLAWQLTLGASVFVTYSVMGTPFFERLIAASRTEGTCSFLIFLSDGAGYAASVSLLLYQDFTTRPAEATSGEAPPGVTHAPELRFFLRLYWRCAGAVAALVLLATGYFARRLPKDVVATAT